MKIDKEILNLAELAMYLELPLPTAYKLVRERDKHANPIPGQKTGKQWRFMRSQIDQWMAGSASITVQNYRGGGSSSPARRTRGGAAPITRADFSSTGADLSEWFTESQLSLLRAGWINDSNDLLQRIGEGKGDDIATTLQITPGTLSLIVEKIRS